MLSTFCKMTDMSVENKWAVLPCRHSECSEKASLKSGPNGPVDTHMYSDLCDWDIQIKQLHSESMCLKEPIMIEALHWGESKTRSWQK